MKGVGREPERVSDDLNAPPMSQDSHPAMSPTPKLSDGIIRDIDRNMALSFVRYRSVLVSPTPKLFKILPLLNAEFIPFLRQPRIDQRLVRCTEVRRTICIPDDV